MDERITLYTPVFENVNSYFEVLDLAYRYGFKKVETINIFELQNADIEVAKSLKRYADERGISFPCVSLGINLACDNNAEQIEFLKKYAHIAATLGAPYLHHTIALDNIDRNDTNACKEIYERGIKAVREVYDYAETLGVKTVFEDQGYLFNGVEAFRHFLTDVERDVKVVADFGNIMFVEEAVEDFITEFSEKIINVHIKDYIFTDSKIRQIEPCELLTHNNNYLKDCLFGKGNVNFDKAFTALKNAGYKGDFALEYLSDHPITDEELRYNVEYLEKYIKRYF